MKMYSIAVAVNLYHSGTPKKKKRGFSWEYICFLLITQGNCAIGDRRAKLSFHAQGMSYRITFETQ